MRKKKYALLLPLLVLFHSHVFCITEAAFNTPESWTHTLNGKIHSIKEYTGSSLDSLVLKRKIVFNEKNYPVSEISYDDEGNIKGEIQYFYSENGPIQEIRGVNAENQLNWKYSYVYDDNLTLLEEISTNARDEIEWKDTYKYNEKGLLTEKINYNADGSANLQDTFQYDEQEHLLFRTTLYSDGKLLKRVSLFYTPAGQVDHEEHYDSNGLYETVQYQYEEEQLHTVTYLAQDGSTKEERVYRYNAEGLLLKEELYVPDKEPITDLTFVYDNYDNWVRKWERSEVYTFREIEYLEKTGK